MKWTESKTIVETAKETATTFGLIPFVAAYKNRAMMPVTKEAITEYCFRVFINHWKNADGATAIPPPKNIKATAVTDGKAKLMIKPKPSRITIPMPTFFLLSGFPS